MAPAAVSAGSAGQSTPTSQHAQPPVPAGATPATTGATTTPTPTGTVGSFLFFFWDYIHSPFISLFLHGFYNNFVHEIYI